MLEPALSSRTLTNERDCLLLDCWLWDIKELNWFKRLWSSMRVPWSCHSLQCGCFQTYIWWFYNSQAIKNINSRIFSKSLFRLIGMVGEAYFPSNAYFSWTPDYTQFILFSCLSDWTFLILRLCISTLWFSEIRFGLLISDPFPRNYHDIARQDPPKTRTKLLLK